MSLAHNDLNVTRLPISPWPHIQNNIQLLYNFAQIKTFFSLMCIFLNNALDFCQIICYSTNDNIYLDIIMNQEREDFLGKNADSPKTKKSPDNPLFAGKKPKRGDGGDLL